MTSRVNLPTAPPAGPKRFYEFDDLRVDPVRRLLLRNGEAVAVTPKALSILLVLLDNRGRVVEKTELIQKIWPDTFVSDANLTQNVSSLRKALGERANDRRYILTVPGRGYGFVGEAREVVEEAEPAPEPAPQSPQAPESPPASEPAAASAPRRSAGLLSGIRRTVEIEAVPPAPRLPPPRRVRRRLRPLALGLAVLAAVVAVWLTGRRPDAATAPSPPLPAPAAAAGPAPTPALEAAVGQRPCVAVLGFRNLSGAEQEDWLAPALAEMLATELGAGSRLRVVTGENVARARRSLSLPYTDRLAGAELGRLHSFLGTDMVVVGAYLTLGPEESSRLRLDLRVLRVPDGETIASLAEVGKESELFDLVARTGTELRQALGVAGLSSDEERAMRALRPGSPTAARLYTQGLARLHAFDAPAARDLLAAAAQAEPGSAVIHAALSQAWSILGFDARAVAEARQAMDLSTSLSREERLAIEARFHAESKAWGKASEIYRSLWTFYPDDLEYGLQLAHSLIMAGRGAEARAMLAELHRLPPPAGEDPRIDLLAARIARRLTDLSEEKRAAEAAAAKGRQSGESVVVSQALILEGDALLSMGRPAEAIPLFREGQAIGEKAGFQWSVGMALSNIGAALQSQGDLEGAEKAFRDSLAVAERLGTAVGLAAQYWSLGELELDRGDLRESLKLLEQARSRYHELGDPVNEAVMLDLIAADLCAQGELDAALRHTEQAVALSRQSGSRSGEARAFQVIGRIFERRGALARARGYDVKAFQLLRATQQAGLAAAALAAAADVTLRLGDLPGAQRRYEHALNAERRAGDRIGMGRVLGSQAHLAHASGDLALAGSLAAEQLRLGRETGARPLVAAALLELGHTRLAAGDGEGARGALTEALAASAAVGDAPRATAARAGLALLELAEGKPAAAVPLARDAAAWYTAHGMAGEESRALALLAEALLGKGELAAARQAAARARAGVAQSDDRELRIVVAARVARVDAAAGAAPRALQELRQAIEEAGRLGLGEAALEARLALGEIQLGRPGQDGAEGRSTLAAVRVDAARRGFALVARRAAGPLPAGVRPLG